MYLRLPPQWEQLNGFSGSILILGRTILKPNASTIRAVTFSRDVEDLGLGSGHAK